MTLGNLSHHKMFSNSKNKEILHDIWGLFVSLFKKKKKFCGKIKSTIK